AAMDTSERAVLASRYGFLSDAASHSGLLLGISNTSWTAHTNQVKTILKEIERAYVKSYNSSGNISNNSFFQQRQMLFRRLNTALSRFGQPKIGGSIVTGDIRSNLGISSKSTIHHWKKLNGPATHIPDFANNHAAVAKMAKNLKRVGYLGIALTGVNAGLNIRKACLTGDDATCSKAKYTETGKATGSVIGGAGGGAVASWAACSLVFGLPTGGTSMFWCALVAGAGGGYVGAKIGGATGEWGGEKFYETDF
ncbi:MAG: hypothetical protein JKY66_00175, partial [Spongiibacteraceae bacterium]|nr:hypothetical protein [Spongiibacteraceae bacterium]